MARALAGSAEGEDIDPWQPHRAVWPLLRVIDGCRGEPWAALLWHYLGANERSAELDQLRAGRRWSTARHLAGLFARYAATRPTMIDSWSQGHDVDASGSPLPADRAWQAELWRRLRGELGVPSPAERVQAALARLRLEPNSSDLPERLSVFGATRLDPDHLLVLSALADHRDVHLWLAHPSPTLWASVQAAIGSATDSARSPVLRRADDPPNPWFAIGSWPISAVTYASCSSPSAQSIPIPRICITEPVNPASRRACSAGCSPTLRQTGPIRPSERATTSRRR